MYIVAATCPGSRMPLPQTVPTEDQLNARRQLKEARGAFRMRKTDARRKIVVGAVVLAQAGRDPVFRAVLQLVLQQHVHAADRSCAAYRLARRLNRGAQ